MVAYYGTASYWNGHLHQMKIQKDFQVITKIDRQKITFFCKMEVFIIHKIKYCMYTFVRFLCVSTCFGIIFLLKVRLGLAWEKMYIPENIFFTYNSLLFLASLNIDADLLTLKGQAYYLLLYTPGMYYEVQLKGSRREFITIQLLHSTVLARDSFHINSQRK